MVTEKKGNMALIDKLLFAVVGLMGLIGVIYTLTIFFVIIPAQDISSQVFNGLISALILQVLLVNTIFIWKIMHKADVVFGEFSKSRHHRSKR